MKAVSLVASLGLISTTKCQAGLLCNSFNVMRLVTWVSLWVCVHYSGDVADAGPQWSGRSCEPAGGRGSGKRSFSNSASQIRDLRRLRQPPDEQLQTWEHVSALSFLISIRQPLVGDCILKNSFSTFYFSTSMIWYEYSIYYSFNRFPFCSLLGIVGTFVFLLISRGYFKNDHSCPVLLFFFFFSKPIVHSPLRSVIVLKWWKPQPTIPKIITLMDNINWNLKTIWISCLINHFNGLHWCNVPKNTKWAKYQYTYLSIVPNVYLQFVCLLNKYGTEAVTVQF